MTTPIPYRKGLPELPDKMRKLPLDHRGYPVPYFVEWVDGKPDFRLVDSIKVQRCVVQNICFICGVPLGRHKAFVVGPMAFLQKISAEPPSHFECAQYAVQACPFILNPNARYREANRPREASEHVLGHNPGLYAIVVAPKYQLNPEGIIFFGGEPGTVTWWSEGQPATEEQITAGVADGLVRIRDHIGGTQ